MKITVWSGERCGTCQMVKQVMKERGMKFEVGDINAIDRPKRDELFRKTVREFMTVTYDEMNYAPIIETDHVAIPSCKISADKIGILLDALEGADAKHASDPSPITPPRRVLRRPNRNADKGPIISISEDSLGVVNTKMTDACKMQTQDAINYITAGMTPKEIEAFMLGFRITRHSDAMLIAKELGFTKDARKIAMRLDPYMSKDIQEMFR